MLRRLQLTTAGESHGPGLTAVLSGVPAGLRLDSAVIARDLARRQHGYGRGRRMEIERDEARIVGGVRGGETLGSPIAFWVENRDWKSWDTIMDPWEVDPHMAGKRRVHSPRPGHADLSGGLKYLRRDLRDVLERASARETAARVACGAVARTLLAALGVEIRRGVRFLGPVGADRPVPGWEEVSRVDDASPLRAIHRDLEDEMVALVDRTKEEGDTLGGAVTVIARGVPPGLGSHVAWGEKLDGRLAQAVMSVPAVKAVEIGAAVAASRGPGSEAHDPIEWEADASAFRRPTNRAGGLEGGVTNGADLVVTAYKKPISTLRKGMPSVDLDTLEPRTSQYERSDVTALPAAGVIAEAMVALVLADAVLEKLGGDSMQELLAHWEATKALQGEWPHRFGET
ncbi:MAG TPA: chorismate synthase [Thermoanaerobaculia bacterium]|nr:chorismate synthase [Thermoanaerobaculia bacterium]